MRTNSLNPTRPVRAGGRYHLVTAVDEGLLRARRFAHEYPICALALIITLGALDPTPAAAANTYQVNTTGDPGPPGTLSLRQAITTANSSAGDTIEFAAALVGSTITLASGQIDITTEMRITGPGAGALTISGHHASRIFNILPTSAGPAVPVAISGLTLTQGNAGNSLFGGAIRSIHVALGVYDSIIRDSTAETGGGIFALGGSTVIIDSRLTGNLAVRDGGGLYAAGDDIFLKRTSVDGNTAAELGAGIRISYGNTIGIEESTISGNVVPQPSGYNIDTHGGGGIALSNVSASAYIVNSTIAQNYAYTNGGGVRLLDMLTANRTEFISCTIAGNAAQFDETGIGISSAAGTSAMFATIVANNVSAGANVPDDLAGSFIANSSLIKSPGSAFITGYYSLIGPDPQLGQLADNGGPTFTMLPATTSPVINAAFCQLQICSSFDQRGAPRAVGDSFADIGAVERQYPEDLIFRSGFNPL